MPAKLRDPAYGGTPAEPRESDMMPQDGLVCVRSHLARRHTVDCLVADLTERGIPIVARLDHAAAARSVGLEMLPAELFIFGNPLAGTPLMRAAPSMAIDLPLKILISEDQAEVCWLTYNDPVWIGRRHGLALPQSRILRAMRDLLVTLATGTARLDKAVE